MRVSQSSLKYWKQREDEARDIYQTQELDYDKEVNGIYNRMLKDIQLQINGFYGKYANDEGITIADARKKAAAMDVQAFADKAKQYVETKDFSNQANRELKLYNLTMKANRLELLKANIGLEMCSGFDEMQEYFDKIMVDRVYDECERQSGILGQTVKCNAKMARSLVGASFNNASFSDRIWMYQGMLKNELSSLLEQGLVQGKHSSVLARELQKKFDVSKFNAQRLMRTELARVQTEAQKQSYDQLGYNQFVFIAEHDSRTCTVCSAMDGMVLTTDKMMPGETVPPMHPMCRCSTAAYISRGKFENMVSKYKVTENSIKTVDYNSNNDIIKDNKRNISINLQFFANKSKQYGKKIGKHAADYGLNPSVKEDREKMVDIINSIVEEYDQIREGQWRGYEDDVLFYIKGNDVVIKTSEDEFVSILKGGTTNERIKNARIKEI